MSNDEIQILTSIINEHQKQTSIMLTNFQNENREAQQRLHERLDSLITKETIARPDCETYRRRCKSEVLAGVEKNSGVPTWIFAVGTVASALIVGMAIYILTGDNQAASLVLAVM